MPDLQVDLEYRPLLNTLHLLGDRPVAQATGAAQLEAARRGPRVRPAEYFEGRTGFDSAFLPGFPVPLPSPTEINRADVLPIAGSPDNRLDYEHFSVVMSRSRRLALFVAVNIHGARSVSVEREGDTWYLDGRIPTEAQIGEALYSDNLLDRGHLVRREDPNWGSGEIPLRANEDTFHFTNCAPQAGAFNQKTWLGLENYVLKNARTWQEKVCVFTGPIFTNQDREYRGARIPSSYWKVLAFLSDQGKPSATAYTLSQARDLEGLEAAYGKFKTYQRSVASIEERTGLDFGMLRDFDGFSNEEARHGIRIESVIEDLGDIRV
jgi:endonuclease G, mitochondrial